MFIKNKDILVAKKYYQYETRFVSSLILKRIITMNPASYPD